MKRTSKTTEKTSWTFLTNHSHVLLCISKNPNNILRDIATEVGITERAVQRIVQDLEDAGYLIKMKEGRNNTYKITQNLPLRHPLEAHKKISELIKLVS